MRLIIISFECLIIFFFLITLFLCSAVILISGEFSDIFRKDLPRAAFVKKDREARRNRANNEKYFVLTIDGCKKTISHFLYLIYLVKVIIICWAVSSLIVKNMVNLVVTRFI